MRARAYAEAVLGSLLVASCGDNTATLDAAVADAPARAPCSARFAGNFTESSRGSADCPAVTADGAAVTLAFSIPTITHASALAVTLRLGAAPAPGVYSPEVIADWTSLLTSAVNSSCIYSAGSDSVPSGSFTLRLDAIDPARGTAHGVLALQQYVHALVMAACGEVPTETVEIAF